MVHVTEPEERARPYAIVLTYSVLFGSHIVHVELSIQSAVLVVPPHIKHVTVCTTCLNIF